MGELRFEFPLKDIKVTGHFNEWRDITDTAGNVIGQKQHKGIDYRADVGIPVFASESGVVVRAAPREPDSPNHKSYGNLIIINHTPNAGADERHIYSLYAHLNSIGVALGKRVKKGQQTGTSGDTGNVDKHLHFEIVDTKGLNESLGWNAEGKTGVPGGVYRKDPGSYLNQETTINGTLSDLSGADRKEVWTQLREMFWGEVEYKANFPISDSLSRTVLTKSQLGRYLKSYVIDAYFRGTKVGEVTKYKELKLDFLFNSTYDSVRDRVAIRYSFRSGPSYQLYWNLDTKKLESSGCVPLDKKALSS